MLPVQLEVGACHWERVARALLVDHIFLPKVVARPREEAFLWVFGQVSLRTLTECMPRQVLLGSSPLLRENKAAHIICVPLLTLQISFLSAIRCLKEQFTGKCMMRNGVLLDRFGNMCKGQVCRLYQQPFLSQRTSPPHFTTFQWATQCCKHLLLE